MGFNAFVKVRKYTLLMDIKKSILKICGEYPENMCSEHPRHEEYSITQSFGQDKDVTQGQF